MPVRVPTLVVRVLVLAMSVRVVIRRPARMRVPAGGRVATLVSVRMVVRVPMHVLMRVLVTVGVSVAMVVHMRMCVRVGVRMSRSRDGN